MSTLLENLNTTGKVEEAQKAVAKYLSECAYNIERFLFEPQKMTDHERISNVTLMAFLVFIANLVTISTFNWLPVFSKLAHDIIMVILTEATALAFISSVIFTIWTVLATLLGLVAIVRWATKDGVGYCRMLREYLPSGCRPMTAKFPKWALFSVIPVMNWAAAKILGYTPVIIGTPFTLFFMIAPFAIVEINLAGCFMSRE